MKKIFIVGVFLLMTIKSQAWIDSVVWNKAIMPHTVLTHGFLGLGMQNKYIDQYFVNGSDTLQIDLVYTHCAAPTAVYIWDSLISIPSSMSQPYYYLIVRAILDSNSVTPYCYIQDRYIDTIFSNVNAPTSLIESDRSKKFSLFPNPTRDNLYITIDNKQADMISIYNVYGMLEKKICCKNEIDIAELNSGIYIVEVYSKNTTYRSKFYKE